MIDRDQHGTDNQGGQKRTPHRSPMDGEAEPGASHTRYFITTFIPAVISLLKRITSQFATRMHP